MTKIILVAVKGLNKEGSVIFIFILEKLRGEKKYFSYDLYKALKNLIPHSSWKHLSKWYQIKVYRLTDAGYNPSSSQVLSNKTFQNSCCSYWRHPLHFTWDYINMSKENDSKLLCYCEVVQYASVNQSNYKGSKN